jgi:hypothetical protein
MRRPGFVRLALPTVAVLLLAACGSLPRLNPQPAGEAAVAPPPAPAQPAGNSGRIEVVQWPIVKIDRKELRASPGARILNSNNLMMTPNQIPPNVRVSYELDGLGQIRTIRVLPADAQR